MVESLRAYVQGLRSCDTDRDLARRRNVSGSGDGAPAQDGAGDLSGVIAEGVRWERGVKYSKSRGVRLRMSPE